MANKINIERIEEYLKQAGLDNGELENLLNPIKELNNQRRYGLVWEEPDNSTYSTDLAEQDLLKNFPFLKEVNEHRIFNGEEHPDHLLIEGDNLHALKTMQYTHKNKIDVIYIDPPYNTGNTDFVYNDKYVDNEDSWRHSKWLSFMNKRLRLARELMTDEGVIFISIDDNELYQLKLLCDQIFGEENFIANLIWKKTGGKNSIKKVSVTTEYVLVYDMGGIEEYANVSLPNTKGYTNPDNDPRGVYRTQQMFRNDGRREYEITTPTGDKISKGWLYTPDNMKQLIDEKRVYWGKNGNSLPRRKVYLKDNEGMKIRSLLRSEIVGNNQRGLQDIIDMFGEKVFEYVKPKELVQELVSLHPNKNATVLDFFAGSGTTAHAVMELNKEDGGNRQAIVITNNEINSTEEEDLLVEKGYVEPFTGSRRGTKKHAKWLEEVNEFKQTPEYLEFIETDEYKDLGIARAVTEQRINKVINGYTTPKNKEVEGLSNNNFYHFEVVLEPDLLDMDLNTYVLVKKTKDIIRIKEGVYTTEDDISTETVPSVKLTDKDKEVIVVLSVRVTYADVEELVQNFNDVGKEHVIYTSYTGFEYGINNIRFEELPKELLQAIKHEEGM